ncbi:MAG: hypothetical protein ABUS48_06480 [Pseudomonadota bacterium]
MGPGFVIVLGLIAGAVLAAGAGLVSGFVWLFAKPKKWPLRAILIGAPLLVGMAPVSLFILGLVLANLTPASTQYERVFGEPSGAQVQGLRATTSAGSDYEDVHMAFRDRGGDDAQLLKHFHTRTGPIEFEIDENPPQWWRGNQCRNSEMYDANSDYAAENHQGSTVWQEITLIRCKDDGMVYVHAWWGD